MFAFLHDSPLGRLYTLKPGDDHVTRYRARGACDLTTGRTFLCADRVVLPEYVDVRIAPSGRLDGPLALRGGRGFAHSGLMRSFVRMPFSGRSSPACVDQTPAGGSEDPLREDSNTRARTFKKRSFT